MKSSQYQRQMLYQQDDDLADYDQIVEDQVYKDVMSFKPLVADDAAQLLQQKKQQKAPKKQLTQQQKLARQLKLKNARKYFQVVKSTYLQQICESLKELKFYQNQRQNFLSQWMSLLTPALLSQYIQFKQTQPLALKIQHLLQFLREAKQHMKMACPLQLYNPAQLVLSVCQDLGLVCRKIHFFDVETFVEQLFYKLRYQMNEKGRKKQNKQSKTQQLLKIHLQKKIQEQLQNDSSHSYLHFQDFEFDPNDMKKSSQATQVHQQSSRTENRFVAKREHNFIRKKNYRNSYFQMFCPSESKWKFFNCQILQFQEIDQFKNFVLEGKFIIGFYGIRLIHFKKQFMPLLALRPTHNFVIDDLTMYFYDNMKSLTARRKRIGVRGIMRQIFNMTKNQQHSFLLTNYDAFIEQSNQKIQSDYFLQIFPKNKQQMLAHQYYTVPSMIPQYMIIDPKAKPVAGLEFQEEKVYLRKDLIGVKSKLGWIDYCRQVKDSQLPVKKTENKSKNQTQLFVYEQTEPFKLRVDPQTGDFVSDDQHNNIYVPPKFVPQEKFIIIDKKISYVCNKAKLRCVQLVQGFNINVGRILPNYIGYLVYRQDAQLIQQLWEQRQQKLLQGKDKNREKELISMWNKLFKKIELAQWSRMFSKN